MNWFPRRPFKLVVRPGTNLTWIGRIKVWIWLRRCDRRIWREMKKKAKRKR